MIKYSTLFELKIFHAFYEQYSSKDFEVIVSGSTRHIFSQYGLVYRLTPDGLIVLYKEDKAELLQKNKGSLRFSFGLSLKNRMFGNFTKLNYGLSNEKYFFRNSQENAAVAGTQAGERNKLLLHKEDSVSDRDVRLFGLSGKLLSELLGEKELKCTSSKGREVFKGVLEGHETLVQILDEEHEDFEVELKESGETVQLSHIPNEFAPCFAVIDIVMGDTPENAFENFRNTEFQLRFFNRSVLLNYFFVSERNKDLSAVRLFIGTDPLEMDETEEVLLPNGQRAIKASPIEQLRLKRNFNGLQYYAELEESNANMSSGSGSKRLSLPTPDITRIKAKWLDGKELYYADMYVYV